MEKSIRMNLKNILIMGCSSLVFSACQQGGSVNDGKAHFLPQDFDKTISLGDDFYQYSNGGWMATHPIPGEKSRLNTFDVLNDENIERLKGIVEEASQSGAAAQTGTDIQKIGDYFALAMDSARREADGIEPIRPLLDEIRNLDFGNIGGEAFAQAVAKLHLCVGNPFFAVGCTPDARNSSMNIAELWQDGIGLPNRDYYFDDSDKGKEIVAGYKRMVAGYLKLLGEADAETKAERVYAFEKSMAGLMNTKVENRDPQKTYNKMTVDELKSAYTSFNWDAYFACMPVAPTELTVGQPRFFKGIFPLMAKTDSTVLRDYLLVNTINYLASYLSDDFALTKFDFYSKQLGGVTERKPLWKRSLDMVQGRLGQPLGRLFVAKYFSDNAKVRMESLIEHLRIAFGERIQQLSWMSDSTKAAALDKLSAIGVKVGYPDVWEDYSEAKVDKTKSLVENYIGLTQFASVKSMREVGQPVDKTKWHMTPQTVNAYYSPLNNEIVFPAGILQPPFFYAEGDDAVNYGAIGVVIGHEMTHGFDDSGRQFGKDGNLHEWWTATDAKQFKEVTNKLKARFSEVVVIDSMRCNGELTLGENIADLGGLNIAHQAFLNTLEEGAPEKLVDGQTYDQRFLFAYSRIWAGNYRDEYLRQQVITDPHANGKYRVNVQLPMLDFFYTAFNIQSENAMYVAPEDRIVIW